MSTVPSAATVGRLEKVAVDNGFDPELGREGGWLCFASSQAPVRLWLTTADDLIYLTALSIAHVVAGLGAFGDPVTPPFPECAVGGRVDEEFRLKRLHLDFGKSIKQLGLVTSNPIILSMGCLRMPSSSSNMRALRVPATEPS